MTSNSKRKKISAFQMASQFSDEAQAEQWFIDERWGQGISCPKCNSNRIFVRNGLKRRTWRCKKCLKDFTTKTGTIMEASNLSFRQWAWAIYLITTNLKGISSTKLASELNMTQKAAWHLGMRIRETLCDHSQMLNGIVEIDETYIGGKESNKHQHKRTPHNQGKSTKTKTAVLGMKARGAKIIATPIRDTSKKTTHALINKHISQGAQIYTDDARQYAAGVKGYPHKAVNHSVKEFVSGQAHTNGIESFWALLKRGYYGTYHWMSRKHLARYVSEFSGRNNMRKQDTIKQMALIVKNMSSKKLRYKDLVS